jgi:SHS2 domain-containing protein
MSWALEKSDYLFGKKLEESKMKFKFFPHTADIKFRAYGKNINEVFDNCALAFCEIIGRGDKIKNNKSKKIKLQGEDNESLLYNFIDELIFLLDAKNFLVCKSKVKVKCEKKGLKLEGEVFGDNASKYEDLDHVKAATYAEMYVKKKSKGWEAQVVVDV